MNVSDPIADMLTRIRNASSARHDVAVVPASKVKVAIAQVLKEEGFIRGYQVEAQGARQTLRLELGYTGRKEPILTGLKRVSRPGLRVYVQKREIPRVFGGLGIAILSTPSGIMTGQRARQKQVGGEVLCYVW
jgi:small subunit ribosomal protein S8